MMSFSECHVVRSFVLHRFYPSALAAATVIFTTGAMAEMSLDPACIHEEGSQASCSHVVACIGGDTLFVGGSVGWDAGVLTGQLSTGGICTGVWNNARATANFTCDDGQTGVVTYSLMDGATGTAIGQGNTLAGRPIEAWSGHNIAEFIERETGRVTLKCGMEDLLLG